MPPLTIISCGIGPASLPSRSYQEIDQAEFIFGSQKLLEQLGNSTAQCIPLGADARTKAAQALDLAQQNCRVVLLASGDALFHGIGGTIHTLLQERQHSDNLVQFIPAETAFQALFHKLGLSWDNARVFSAHKDGLHPWGEILSSPLAVIYGGFPWTADHLAAECLRRSPASATRLAVAAEDLGTPQERIIQAPLAQLAQESFSPTSILLLLPSLDAHHAATLPLGIDNEQYSKENNLITDQDVRAIILARLQLPAWGVLWDIGAGSGSIGLEAAALRPALRVLGLEKNPARLANILENRNRLATPNYELLEGTAPNDLIKMPQPDRIFIGGGGPAMESILRASLHALRPEGRIVVSAVTLESTHLVYSLFPAHRIDFTEITIARERSLAGHYHSLQAGNRISIFTFSSHE